MEIKAEQFGCSEAHKKDFGARIIQFSSEDFDDQPVGKHLFWGPYLELKPGVYIATVQGKLKGHLTLEVVYRGGNSVIKKQTIDELNPLVCFVLLQPVQDLEIRAVKTPGFKTLTLEAVSLSCAYLAQ